MTVQQPHNDGILRVALSGLSAAQRRRVERFVRPLYTELDGLQTFGRVAELEGWIEAIEPVAPVDPPRDMLYLELLVLLHGVIDRLGATGEESRFGLFLKSLELPEHTVARLPLGLARLESDPQTQEERLLHDALRLERTGVRAAATKLMFFGKKRTPLSKVVRLLSPGPPLAGYCLERSRELAKEPRQQAQKWIEQLAQSLDPLT